MMRNFKTPLCACGRRRINGGREECSECRQEQRPLRPLCACGRRRFHTGREMCSECSPAGYAPCAVCGRPSKGDICHPCSGAIQRDERRGRVVERLRKKGVTFAEIGRRMGGISRQRVEQILRRHRSNARKAVTEALKLGRLERPAHCERCERELPVEAHHFDYNRPLDVTWLCRPCHNTVHPHHPQVRGRQMGLPVREPQGATA